MYGISDQRWKEVAVMLNSYYNTMLKGHQISKILIKLAIPDVLQSIAEEYYTDTMEREYILELVSKEIVGMSYPVYGDSDETKALFLEKATEAGLLPKHNGSM